MPKGNDIIVDSIESVRKVAESKSFEELAACMERLLARLEELREEVAILEDQYYTILDVWRTKQEKGGKDGP